MNRYRSSLFAAALMVALAGAVDAAPPPELGAAAGKVIWLDFWASWCVPCRRSFPWMNTIHEKYGPQGLEIVAVNLDRERSAAEGFLAETPAAFKVRFDPEGKLAREFEVQAMPSSYLLDPSGKVIARHFGFKLGDTDDYERQIQEALAAARASQ